MGASFGRKGRLYPVPLEIRLRGHCVVALCHVHPLDNTTTKGQEEVDISNISLKEQTSNVRQPQTMQVGGVTRGRIRAHTWNRGYLSCKVSLTS